MEFPRLKKTVYILLFLFLLFSALVYAKSFLIPVTFAALLSMLLLPISTKLESKGWNKALAVLASVLALVLFFAIIFSLLAWQISDMAKEAPKIEKNLSQKVNEVKTYLANSFGISQQKQQEMMQKQQASSGGKLASMFTTALTGFGSILANSLLVLIYIFLFMFYRTHLKKFILKLVPPQDHQKAVKTIEDSRKVAQKYISGMAMMIAFLWVMYGIGFSIAGVKNAIFFAMLCGTLEIVPFVGNITGTLLTILMSFAQGGSSSMVIGIIITYAVVQFIQSYILEPLVVGSEVNINPLFTIVGIIGWEFIWGIPGMILAVPIMGIVKIVCDNVEPLKPYGFLLGEEKKKSNNNLIDKVKGWFK